LDTVENSDILQGPALIDNFLLLIGLFLIYYYKIERCFDINVTRVALPVSFSTVSLISAPPSMTCGWQCADAERWCNMAAIAVRSGEQLPVPDFATGAVGRT
jgi:hypothetical protein